MGTKNLISNGFVREGEDGSSSRRVACNSSASSVEAVSAVNGGAQTTLIHKARKRHNAKITLETHHPIPHMHWGLTYNFNFAWPKDLTAVLI